MNQLTEDRCRVLACPKCGEPINVGALLGSIRSRRKAKAARENGKLGGRPRRKPAK